MTTGPFTVPESVGVDLAPRPASITWLVFGEQISEVLVGTVTAPSKQVAESLGQQLAAQHRRRLMRVQSAASAAVEAEERKVAARHRQKGWRDPDPEIPPTLASLRGLQDALRAHRASRPARESARTKPESAS